MVCQTGDITHKKNQFKFRPAAGEKRGKIAKALKKGVGNYFYKQLKQTPHAELVSGNISRSLNKNVLKVIKSELSQRTRMHDDVFMELYLTQNILRECDTGFQKISGYIQLLQVDPFCIHMYTETGINILVQHLRDKKPRTPVTLYLDATGNVVAKLPNQPKRVLYYCLTLPGSGPNAPPLPVSEMLTNEHSIPPITF